jgi:hypothetical protein
VLNGEDSKEQSVQQDRPLNRDDCGAIDVLRNANFQNKSDCVEKGPQEDDIRSDSVEQKQKFFHDNTDLIE